MVWWELLLVFSPRLTEMGIKSFWDMIDIAKKESLSIRDWVMQMPPVGRVRCLEALMADNEATPPPESHRHSVNMQETVDIMAEYRRFLEGVLRNLMLQVWQSCARQLFATADPVRFIGEGASGINAGATRGLDAKVMDDSDLLRTNQHSGVEDLALVVHGPVRRSGRAAMPHPRGSEQ